MLIVASQKREPYTASPCAVALGAFDGLHKGHRALIEKLLSVSGEKGLCSMVYTFDPHPDVVLHPDKPLPLLMSKTEKESVLGSWGIDVLYCQEFNKEFHTMSPGDFIEFIVSHLEVRVVVAGYDYRFGYNGSGDADMLTEICRSQGVEVIIIPPVSIDGVVVSSSRIRQALGEGDITLANHMLGYPYTIQGEIIPGWGRGRTLGYRTANLKMDEPAKMLPKRGVYITEAAWEGQRSHAITNVGVNPTFERDYAVRIETHIPGWSGELYGKAMKLAFLHRLRDESTFSSREALIGQLCCDMEAFQKFVYKKKDM